jgi:hypothetical protein
VRDGSGGYGEKAVTVSGETHNLGYDAIRIGGKGIGLRGESWDRGALEATATRLVRRIFGCTIDVGTTNTVVRASRQVTQPSETGAPAVLATALS